MIDLLKAVLFDMDGVITDTMSFHYCSWHKILLEEDIPITELEIYQREGQKGIVSIREIFAQYEKPYSSKRGREILLKKERLFKKIARTRFIVGARPFIKVLKRKNIRLALVTGTSRHEVYRILPKNLLKCFSVIISGSDVTKGKPHPEPYLKALKALKISKKGEVVVIENAPLGILSAKAANLTCFAIETSLPKHYLKDADVVFPGFSALKTYFQKKYQL